MKKKIVIFTEEFTMTNFELTDVYMLFDDDISDLYDEMKAEIEDGGQPKQRTKANFICIHSVIE